MMSIRTRSQDRLKVGGVSMPVDHYIDGQRVSSDDRFEVRSPIDWENWKLADVAAGGSTVVDVAVSAARRAFTGWAALGPYTRLEVLTRLADAIDAAVPDLDGDGSTSSVDFLHTLCKRTLRRVPQST